jgi:hypothetical protein
MLLISTMTTFTPFSWMDSPGRDAYWSRGDDQPPYADKTVIGRLGFELGQEFLYLFDFGDEWKFDVRVEEILDSGVPPVRPLVIGSKGEASEQYPDYENDIEL